MNVIKQRKKSLQVAYAKRKGTPRKLLGAWTTETAEDLMFAHGVGVEEELAKILTAEIETSYTDEMREADIVIANQWKVLMNRLT